MSLRFFRIKHLLTATKYDPDTQELFYRKSLKKKGLKFWWRAVCRLAKRQKKRRQKYCQHIAHLTAKTSNVDGRYVDKSVGILRVGISLFNIMLTTRKVLFLVISVAQPFETRTYLILIKNINKNLSKSHTKGI